MTESFRLGYFFVPCIGVKKVVYCSYQTNPKG